MMPITSGLKENSASSRVENSSDDHQSLLGKDILAQSLPLLLSKADLKKMESVKVSLL
jgi:hypothetical protein